MTSKKVLKGKDARLPRRNEVTREFRKDWLALQRAGTNLAALKEAMTLLIANEGPPGPEWSDHPLKGRWDGFRECHAGVLRTKPVCTPPRGCCVLISYGNGPIVLVEMDWDYPVGAGGVGQPAPPSAS